MADPPVSPGAQGIGAQPKGRRRIPCPPPPPPNLPIHRETARPHSAMRHSHLQLQRGNKMNEKPKRVEAGRYRYRGHSIIRHPDRTWTVYLKGQPVRDDLKSLSEAQAWVDEWGDLPDPG